ncbi:MAG: hypothetical protein R2745_24850 [Vicinamibacterales bacterium]
MTGTSRAFAAQPPLNWAAEAAQPLLNWAAEAAQPLLNWAADDGARVAALEKDGTRLQGEHVVLYVPKSLPRADADALAARLDRGVAGLWQRVGVHDWQAVKPGRITYYLSDDTFVAHASGRSAVFVPMARVTDGRAPFLHEATHELLASTRTDPAGSTVRRPLWLTEGLPDYIARITAADVGMTETGPFGTPTVEGADAVCAERARTADGATMLPFVGADERPAVLFTTDRARFAPTFYACSFSFVASLASEAGLAQLVDLFSVAPAETRARLDRLGGRTLDEHRQAWLRRLALAAVQAPDDDAQVYHAATTALRLEAPAGGRRYAVQDPAFDPTPLWTDPATGAIQPSVDPRRLMTGARPETIEAFFDAVRRPRALPRHLEALGPWRLVAARDLPDRSRPAAWAPFADARGLAGSVVRVSAIGYDRARTQALVAVSQTCGPLCASGCLVLLDRRDGGWVVATAALIVEA